MIQEEYRAIKEGKEPGTPQAPQRAVEPETPPVENQDPPQVPEGDIAPQIPEGGQEPIQQEPPGIPPENEAAMYRRKYQEADGRIGLLQQQLQLQQQQLQTILQQSQAQTQATQAQEERMPEFEDPQQALQWIREDNARQRKTEIDALRSEFKETTLKTEREQAAGRIISSYPDMKNASSLLYQQFASDCAQKGINPQTADPLTLEPLAAFSAAKCGVLPQSVQPNISPRQPLQTARPNQFPGIQKMPPPAPPQPVYNLTSNQSRWCEITGRDPSKLTSFMKDNATKYVKADGTPLYGRRS